MKTFPVNEVRWSVDEGKKKVAAEVKQIQCGVNEMADSEELFASSFPTKRIYAMGSCFNTFLDQFELIIAHQGLIYAPFFQRQEKNCSPNSSPPTAA